MSRDAEISISNRGILRCCMETFGRDSFAEFSKDV